MITFRPAWAWSAAWAWWLHGARMPRAAKAPVTSAGTQDGQGASRPGRGGFVLPVPRPPRLRLIQQDPQGAVAAAGRGRVRNGSGWGQGGECGHSYLSVTSCPAMLGD